MMNEFAEADLPERIAVAQSSTLFPLRMHAVTASGVVEEALAVKAAMFDRLGVRTGVDLEALVAVAQDAVSLPGAIPGGRVRDALAASRRLERPS